MNRALVLLLLVAGMAINTVARQSDDGVAPTGAPDLSVLGFDWKYAGYHRAETVKGNETIANNDSSTSVKLSRKTIYVFKYTAKATLKNTGAKTIKAISWDYVFTDMKERKELKRYRLQSKQQLLPGEMQTLVRDVGINTKDDTRHITTGRQSVEITRIEYTDGSVWRQKQ